MEYRYSFKAPLAQVREYAPSDANDFHCLRSDHISNPLVSVIMPVYNTEAYVHEALTSIRDQSLKEIEIICIDDGSSDGSLAILLKNAEQDARISVYTQKNSGQGTARNEGILEARGHYIYFMDSDDLLEPSALASLYERASANDLDILCFAGSSFFDDSSLIASHSWIANDYAIHDNVSPAAGCDLLCRLCETGSFSASACLKLFSRPFLLEHHLAFP